MQLPVSLEFQLESEAAMACWKSFGWPSPRMRFWKSLLDYWLWFAGFFIGLATAFAGGYDLAACLILSIICWYILSLRRASESLPFQWRSRKVRVDLAENGITEHAEGIQKFIPWDSMEAWHRCASFILIELRNHTAAIIADRDVSGQPIDLQQMANLLLERGVKERK